MKLRRVAIVVHDGMIEARRRAAELSTWLSEHGIDVNDEGADLVVSLGGDGTMLRAAQLAHAADIPLLGVNLGTLGYLTEVDAGAERAALERIAADDLEIDERVMLRAEVDGDSFVGLNEVLVERASRHRLVRLAVRIDGEDLAAFNADGVIVATPTGSTAYALSAGGPIVSPRAACVLVVPVSAHMIFARPFVLAPDEKVEITIDRDGGDGFLSLDGALGRELTAGSLVTVEAHERPLRLIRLSGPGFLERLRAKLGLPG